MSFRQIGNCKDCLYFTHARKLESGLYEGYCHRYPEEIEHVSCYWCGEFFPSQDDDWKFYSEDQKSDELKPCPLCDGEATLIAARQREDGAYRPAACGCDKCNIWRYGEIDYGHDGFATEKDFKESMEQAVSNWNACAC